MTDITNVLAAIRKAAPENLQESWDNSGIQVLPDADAEIGRILSCIEISDAIVDEAIEKKVDMIVTHHPLIFGKIASVTADDVVGGQIIRLIRAGIAVYSAHTSFDSARMGTNEDLARQLGLTDLRPIEPAAADPETGMGRIGVYEEAMAFESFLELCRGICGTSVRVAGVIPERVGKVMLCTGAGSEFIDAAHAEGADVFVTGDLKYHDARHAYDIGMCVIDGGHYGTEVLFGENMAAQLREILGDSVEVLVAETDIDPFITL